MKITQELARKAAKLLTAKTDNTIEALSKEINTTSRDAYMKSLPKGLLAFDKANPGWLSMDEDLRVKYYDGGQFKTFYPNIDVAVPTKDGGPKLTANKELKGKIIRLQELIEKRQHLRQETYVAILDLGTSKKVIQAFPETAELFGASKPGESAVVPTIVDLKKKLQKQ